MDIGGAVHRLVPGDYAFVPIGTWHALGNGGSDARSVARREHAPAPATRRRPPRHVLRAEAFDVTALAARAMRPRVRRADTKYVGHYDGTPPQLEALRVDDPVRERRPVGMDTALLAYSGISVKMLVDRGFGADLLTMFTVDYEAGGAAQAHDHPFEEAYFFLDGPDRGGARRHALRAPGGRRGVRRRRRGARVLEHRDRTRPLARDPGPAAAGAPLLPLGRAVEAMET